MDLTLSTQVRQRLLYGLLVLGVFIAGIGATKGWDALARYHAEQALFRFNTQIITALVAQHPEVAAAIQRAQQQAAAPPAPPAPDPEPTEPDPTPEPDPPPDPDEEPEPDVDAP